MEFRRITSLYVLKLLGMQSKVFGAVAHWLTEYKAAFRLIALQRLRFHLSVSCKSLPFAI